MTTVVEIVSQRIVVVDGSTRCELTLTTVTPPPIAVASPGPQGPPGAQGPPGPAGGEQFVYDRGGVPAATWTIVHGLGRYPPVSVLTDDHVEVDSDVVHADLNTTVITFAVPFSGKAIIG
ncbi:hypothetical protein [Microbispora sp. NPDC049125]|uniref:hypothetical protein n=1 Tax=Microbispora sp. NPDC049125 TaxID=3154929 RepID=UPI003464EE56